MFTPAGNEKEMDGISAGEVMEEPARDFRIPASEIHPRLFYSNDLRLRREGGRIDTFKQHHSFETSLGGKKVSETNEKDRKCENSRRHEPCSTKPHKRAGAAGRQQPQRRMDWERAWSL